MSTVTLMQGDCCEKLNGIPAHSVNLVLADPPYGITHQAWDSVLPFEYSSRRILVTSVVS